MEKRIIVISLEEYFQTINFIGKGLKDQVAYLLFYVTHISNLRSDMTAEIIADRINNQIRMENKKCNSKIDYVTADSVKETLCDNEYFEMASTIDKSQFDRKDKQKLIPYVLSKKMTDILFSEFDCKILSKLKFLRKQTRTDIFVLLLFIFLFFFTILLYEYKSDDVIDQLSWSEYVEYSGILESKPEKQSLMLLYYITKATKLNESMSVRSISDRLYDISHTEISSDSLLILLRKSELVKEIDDRQNLFIPSEIGLTKVETVISTNFKTKYMVSLGWLLKQTQPGAIVSLLGILFPLLGIAYGIGKYVSSKSQI